MFNPISVCTLLSNVTIVDCHSDKIFTILEL